MTQLPPAEEARSLKTMPFVIYILYLASFITGITPLIGVVLAYVNRGGAPAWLETHYTFLIRTFWIGLLYTVIGGVTLIFIVGWLVLLAASVWLIVRCAKGLSWLDRNEPVPDPYTWGF